MSNDSRFDIFVNCVFDGEAAATLFVEWVVTLYLALILELIMFIEVIYGLVTCTVLTYL